MKSAPHNETRENLCVRVVTPAFALNSPIHQGTAETSASAADWNSSKIGLAKTARANTPVTAIPNATTSIGGTASRPSACGAATNNTRAIFHTQASYTTLLLLYSEKK